MLLRIESLWCMKVLQDAWRVRLTRTPWIHPVSYPGYARLPVQRRCVSGAGSELIPELARSPVQLRDYQEECIRSVLSAFEQGHRRVGISLATGSGKTVIFTQLIGRVGPLVRSRVEDATQTLILAHRRELVEQAARHCANAYPDKTIEIEMGKLSSSGRADVTIASVQSLISGDRLLKFDPQRFKLVLVDEAHHIVAQGYLKVLRHMGLASKQPDSPRLVGVSATFSRADGLRLGAAIDQIVYHKDYVDMIGGKWLSDVAFTTVQSTADLSTVKKTAYDFEISSLSRAINTDQVNDITVRTWMAKTEGRQSTLVFCVDLAHVTALTQRFRDYGVDARFVTGDTPDRERAERLDAFRNRKFPVLVNCGVFTEGTDIPNIDCVLLARPTRSRNLLVQMIGRGMRLFPGKENCYIIDMVSSLETGIITTPTLFGLDPDELVESKSVEDMRDMRERKDKERAQEQEAQSHKPGGPAMRGHKLAFTKYDTIFDLITDTAGEQNIRSISQFAWVQVAADRYVLSGPGGSFMRIEKVVEPESKAPNEPAWKAWLVRALPPGVAKSPYAKPREILTASTFLDAVHGCDKYAKDSAADMFPYGFVGKRVRWRLDPPTEGQLKMLNKLRNPNDQLGPTDITKGRANDMITKLKHGARGRFANLDATRKRMERVEASQNREQARMLGEYISVGPVQ